MRNDGVGFDPRVLSRWLADGHIGLALHRARIESIGGRIDFRSLTPGTEVRVQIPARYEPINRQDT